MGKLYLRIFVCVLLSSFICGCATIGDLIESLIPSQPEERDPSAEKAFYDDGVPRIRPGVVMSVQVGAGAQAPMSMQVQVDQKGEITLPYLLQSPVLCHGLTLDSLKQKLTRAYQMYIKQPVVTVAFVPVLNNEGVSPYGFVTVLGEVASPGPVNMPATMDLTVMKALKVAGGLRPFANKERICVTSCDRDGNKKRTIINIKEIGEGGHISKDIMLRAGDVVWVPETWY